jgi:AraC-like DNA-binding protein
VSAQPDTLWPEANPIYPVDAASVAIGGLTCSLSVESYSGTHACELVAERHHFCSVRDVQDATRLSIYGSFDSEPRIARCVRGQDSFFLPVGRRWVGKRKGKATVRVLTCDLEPSSFADAFGDRIGELDLQPHFGSVPMAPGLLERLEALCLAPDTFPRSYADALAVILICELMRACTGKEFPPRSTANVGTSRFRPVLDHIEDTLGADTSLSTLAALTGLSVSHFSHAFNTAYGVAPHRYILQRRIEKAKLLLSTSNATITVISQRVGFSNQSRFSQIFAQQTHLSPSAYRAERLR